MATTYTCDYNVWHDSPENECKQPGVYDITFEWREGINTIRHEHVYDTCANHLPEGVAITMAEKETHPQFESVRIINRAITAANRRIMNQAAREERKGQK